MEGTALPREHQLLAASITKLVNRVAAARLVFVDGEAARGDFPLQGSDTFLPGKEVEIMAGSGDDPVTLFKGIVIRQGLKVRERSAPQLVVECRHQAVKLTVGRKSAYYLEQKDSEAIETILANAGIEADVEETGVTHRELVQFVATDWDFLLTRAEANGKLVFTDDNGVSVKAPAEDATAVCTLQFGATILEMDTGVDARGQFAGIQGVAWDSARQEILTQEATDPGINGPGNFAASDLADVVGLDALRLAASSITEEEARIWADGRLARTRLSKVAGRVKCEGIGTVKPGHIVELAGVGSRTSGNVFVTGVCQEFDTVQGWKTHIQFGGVDRVFAEECQVSAPRAGALLPAVSGLQVGVVVSNEDPDGEHRVQVRMPLVSLEADGVWARVASLDAGDDRGFFFRPEIGDEVVLGFFNDDPRHPVILGMLHSSAKAAPLAGSDDNHEKLYRSRSGMRVYFNDDTKVLQLETPGGNSVTLSEEDRAVTIADQHGNSITMNENGITVESASVLALKAGTELKLESSAALEVSGGANLKLEGASGVELSSPGTTTVRGSLVQIN